MALLKDRVGIQIVGGATCPTAIDRQLALLGRAEHICIGHAVAAIRAYQTLRMKVVQNPLRAFSRAEQVGDRKFHAA